MIKRVWSWLSWTGRSGNGNGNGNVNKRNNSASNANTSITVPNSSFASASSTNITDRNGSTANNADAVTNTNNPINPSTLITIPNAKTGITPLSYGIADSDSVYPKVDNPVLSAAEPVSAAADPAILPVSRTGISPSSPLSTSSSPVISPLSTSELGFPFSASPSVPAAASSPGCSDSMAGLIQGDFLLTVHCARELKSHNFLTRMSPQVCLLFHSAVETSRPNLRGHTEPNWNSEVLSLYINGEAKETVEVEVLDGDVSLGMVKFFLYTLLHSMDKQWFRLHSRKHPEKVKGLIQLSWTFKQHPPTVQTFNQQPPSQRQQQQQQQHSAVRSPSPPPYQHDQQQHHQQQIQPILFNALDTGEQSHTRPPHRLQQVKNKQHTPTQTT